MHISLSVFFFFLCPLNMIAMNMRKALPLMQSIDAVISIIDPTKSCNGTLSHKDYLIGKSSLETKKKEILLEALELQAQDTHDQTGFEVACAMQSALVEGKLPLWCATIENKEKAVEFFLSQGNECGSLHVIFALNRKNNVMAKLFLHAGALKKGTFAFYIEDHPLVLALKNGEQEIIDMVLQAGVDLNEKHKSRQQQKVTIPEYLQQINFAVDAKYCDKIFPEKQKDLKQETSECPICCDTKPEITTICKHSFCNECLNKWFKAHSSCPLCRHKLIN